MEYIFFGNHSSLPGRLERALSQHVVECPTLTQFCQAMIHVNPVNFCVFLEKDDVKEDLDTIQKLRQLYSAAYIILFANSLDKSRCKLCYHRKHNKRRVASFTCDSRRLPVQKNNM